MMTRSGLFLGIERTRNPSGRNNNTWLLASRHYPWSITWSWVLYWTRLGKCPWGVWIKTMGFSFFRQEVDPWPGDTRAPKAVGK